MDSQHISSTAEPGWVSMQLAFSTADVERSIFFAPTGRVELVPAVSPVHEPPVVEAEGSVGNPVSDDVAVITVIHGTVYHVLPDAPPDTWPSDPESPLFRLAGD